ncbi:MAG: hypothetical protein HYX22_02320 [Candidatus Yanofskybacteria bacterium]|nr:hypothetical protein [Candidatus Yanofskybacteria bacterium]
MRKGLVLALIVFFFCTNFARADTPPAVSLSKPFPANCSVPIPDMSNWPIIRKTRVEFRISDETPAYLGAAIEYKNYRGSADFGEFIQMFGRHTPFIPQRQKPDEQSFFQTAAFLYAQQEEETTLRQLDKQIDPILYIRWRVKTDQRVNGDKLDADVDVWFLQSNGRCLFAQNEKISIQLLTESMGDGESRNVFAGVRYKIDDLSHILKADRRDIANLMNGGR